MASDDCIFIKPVTVTKLRSVPPMFFFSLSRNQKTHNKHQLKYNCHPPEHYLQEIFFLNVLI